MQIQKFPILKTTDGQTIYCSCPGCKRAARHMHHLQYRSEGGADSFDNLVPVCQKCHVALHSAHGDFKKWGSFGGVLTAQTKWHVTFRNLVQFRGETGELRWLNFIERKTCELLGIAS